jgi:dipeptidyl-peptidase-4
MVNRYAAVSSRLAIWAVMTLALAPAGASGLNSDNPGFDSQRLERARAFSAEALAPTVKNGDVVPTWIDGERFWFKRQTGPGFEFVVIDAATGKQVAAGDKPPPGVAQAKTSPADVPSPDGRFSAFVRDHNIWLRELASGRERQLTWDGIEAHAYGDTAFGDLMRVMRRRIGTSKPPEGIVWSPDGRYLVAMRADLRNIPLRPVVTEYAPKDSVFAIVHLDHYPIAADEGSPPRTITAIEVDTGASASAGIDSLRLQDYAPVYFAFGVVWWSLESRELYFITGTRDATHYGLAALDLRTGRVRTVIEETERHYYSLNPYDYAHPNVRVLRDGAEAIWYSQRSGYGHLYLYDARRGKLKRAITSGDWVVFDLLHVDEAKRLVYFTAGGREKGGNPYYRHLYRVSLDGGAPQLLTPEDADHQFTNHFGLFTTLYGASQSRISPSGRFFVDVYSTVDQPPAAVIRDSAGRLVSRLIEADVSALRATGWRPPERFVAKAADGATDLYGVLYRPSDFDPNRHYAVIDCMYPGPQGSWSPQTFMDNLRGNSVMFGANMQALADLGFIVVELDGRGTSRRSREFRYAFSDSEDVLGAADHKAAIEHLAAERPWMDVNRVGVTGASFGGYGSLRAALLYPDFFDVCVSMVGPADFRTMGLSLTNDRFFRYPGRSKADAEFAELITNTRLATRLKGRLLLVYGGLDENVPFNQAFLLFDALIDAGKDFDTLIVPNSTHAVLRQPYVIRRAMEYFTEHLGPPT